MQAPDSVLMLADSELAAVELGVPGRSASLTLRFSAAAMGAPRWKGAAVVLQGYWQGLTLVCQDARWTGEPAACRGLLREARLWVQGQTGILQAQACKVEGPIELRLQTQQGARLRIEAESLQLHMPPAHAWRESLSC